MDTISVNLNHELATKAKPILSRYGIDIETALNVYLMQVISDIKPLLQRNENVEYVRSAFQFGCLKGVDDFSDVIADFRSIWNEVFT